MWWQTACALASIASTVAAPVPFRSTCWARCWLIVGNVSVQPVVGVCASLTINVVLPLVVAKVCPIVNLKQCILSCLVAGITTWDDVLAGLATFFCQIVVCVAAAGTKGIDKHIWTFTIAFAYLVALVVSNNFQKRILACQASFFILACITSNDCSWTTFANFSWKIVSNYTLLASS